MKSACDTVYEVTEHVALLNEALETEIDCPPTGENRISIQAREGELKLARRRDPHFGTIIAFLFCLGQILQGREVW